MQDIIITFLSHYDAVNFLTKNKQEYTELKLMPTPRQLGSSCGSCIKYFGKLEDIYMMDLECFDIIYIVENNKFIKVKEYE